MAGVTALAAYYVEHQDRYCEWIGGTEESEPGSSGTYPDGISFEACMIRNCAGALTQLWR